MVQYVKIKLSLPYPGFPNPVVYRVLSDGTDIGTVTRSGDRWTAARGPWKYARTFTTRAAAAAVLQTAPVSAPIPAPIPQIECLYIVVNDIDEAITGFHDGRFPLWGSVDDAVRMPAAKADQWAEFFTGCRTIAVG